LLIVVAIILIIAAIAVPNLLRARMSANEASAVATLRTLSDANATYLSLYNVGFAGSLTNLGPSTAPTSAAADLVDAILGQSTPIKSGYAFTYTSANATPSQSSPNLTFSLTGTPTAAGSSGTSTFCVDQTHVVGKNAQGAAPGNTATGCNFTITTPM
jgi:type II secretory pathway pseudopilin PulG